jgi:dipeptidyl aminopeptidase/acylaminoacyl peptidase
MPKQPLRLFYFILGVTFVLNVKAQPKIDDSLTVEKAISFYRLSSPVFSPDGKKLAFTVTEPAKADKPSTNHIWLFDLSNNSTRQYTNSAKSENSPKWSPDGKQLAFLSNRNGENQVFLLSAEGGEANPLTSSKTGVSAFEWSPDGRTIAYVEKDSITTEEKKRKEDKFDENISNSDKPSVLLSIDVSTKNTHRLSLLNLHINNLKWMPSGDGLLLETEPLPSKEIPELQLLKYEMKDSSFKNISSLKNPSWGGIEMAPEGNLFSFVGPRADGPVGHDLYLQSVRDGHAINISADKIDLPVHAVRFISGYELVAIVQRGFHSRLYSIATNGKATDLNINQNVLSYDIRPDHTVVFVSGSSTHLMELWLSRPGQEAQQITHFNKAFEGLPLIAPEIVTYKSFDGTPIESLFFKPIKINGNALLPMVVIIHGGPTGAFIDSYNTWAQLFLQRGYAVMMPNIRGSTGYGWKFLESNRKDWGGGDFKDIMTGVDHMIANKHIDSSKLAIVGWSYGGYMSEWAITQTNRFKAAMSGAGLFNLASEFGTEGGAAYDNWCLGTPYENMDVFANHSAITFVKNAHTPMLIIQGEDDDVDPIGQSKELYRALRYYNVTSELVTYPREHHGFVEPAHTIDYITRMINWVEKYCSKK